MNSYWRQINEILNIFDPIGIRDQEGYPLYEYSRVTDSIYKIMQDGKFNYENLYNLLSTDFSDLLGFDTNCELFAVIINTLYDWWRVKVAPKNNILEVHSVLIKKTRLSSNTGGKYHSDLPFMTTVKKNIKS